VSADIFVLGVWPKLTRSHLTSNPLETLNQSRRLFLGDDADLTEHCGVGNRPLEILPRHSQIDLYR
jgi:hypothetical protein